MMATCAPRLPQRNWPHVFDVALNNMTGWTQVNDLLWTVTLSVVQRIHNVCGAVGEIGVHHGAYYTVLAATAQPSEPLWACDVFEEGFRSGYNVDRSGRGSKTRLLENVRRALDGSADSEREIVLSPFTSLRLHDAETAKIVDDRVGRFRLLSVDGGHSEVVAFSDLRWTASRILPGGVIALDDVLVSGWPGVSRAVRAFYHMLDRRHERLRPLLLTEKKLFMVTPAVHALYLRNLCALGANTKSVMRTFEQNGALPPHCPHPRGHVWDKLTTIPVTLLGDLLTAADPNWNGTAYLSPAQAGLLREFEESLARCEPPPAWQVRDLKPSDGVRSADARRLLAPREA